MQETKKKETQKNNHLSRANNMQWLPCLALALCFLVFCPGPRVALAQEAGFTLFNEKNGLPSGFVTRVFKDSRGILWLGTTNGLSRFDGRSFTTYGLETGIPDLHVKFVDEHADGRLIAGFHKGVYFFDGQRFSPVMEGPANGDGFYYYKKQPFYDTATKLIINGVHYAWQANRFVAISPNAYPPFSTWIKFRSDTLISFPEGALYFSAQNKREMLLPATGLKTVFRFLNPDTILVARKNGIYCFNGKKLTLLKPLQINTPLDVLEMTVSEDRLVWLSIEGYGTLCYDLYRKTLEHYHNGNSVLSHFDIPYYFGDNMVWFASSGGLIKCHVKNYTLLNRESHPALQNIRGFFPTGQNNFLLSTGRALYRVNLNGGKVATIQPCNSIDAHEPVTQIGPAGIPGTFWLFDNASGLAAYHWQSEKVFKPAWMQSADYRQTPMFKPWYSARLNGSLVPLPGRVLLAGMDKVVKTLPVSGGGNRLLRGFAEDSRGGTWGFHLDGICKLSGNDFKPVNLTPSLPSTAEVICMLVLKDTLWAGTIADGLYGMVETADGLKRVVHINENNGLYGNCVYQAVTDRQGDIWLLTNRGLQCLMAKNGSRKPITYHNENLAFSALFFSGLQADDEGNIWYSNHHFIAGINPQLFKQTIPQSKVFITSVSQNDAVFPGAFSQGSFSFSAPGNLTLGHRQNNLKIAFSAMCYNDEGLLYRFRLDGAEDTWNTDQKTEQVTYTGLAPGRYTFRVSASTPAGRYGPETAFSFTIRPPFYKTTAFILSALCLAGLIIFFAYRYKLKLLARESALNVQQNKRMAQMHMQALQAQMNPHFIFNSLNSIQDYILSHEPAEASRYLAKFAKLVRLILDNSSRNQMPLEEVADMMNRYLELESLRMDEDFEYIISLDENIDAAQTAIPFMMVQPFVENAIWHGLMPKKGKKILHLAVMPDGAKGIKIVIDDNGVGRKKQEPETQTHKSIGSKIARESFEALSTLLNLESSLEIKDKLDQNGAPAGTAVTIHLPHTENENHG